jgi:flagellar basal body-associated protein FliL
MPTGMHTLTVMRMMVVVMMMIVVVMMMVFAKHTNHADDPSAYMHTHIHTYAQTHA